eukprot:CAMPEP_0113715902 /NCGR_PEP_ID=MMETSP0038_2-20120614/33553_1 /TAXON_ID=2898 /ORGANISM="Cryptomonas paramecium" /LENGTH=93 /DNA_ID=CAMNT_0000643287 /DNA_START=618 /DNA_END=895 /DNA_ORIENTATION=- /assembly_acc=CAM_ASM_000170
MYNNASAPKLAAQLAVEVEDGPILAHLGEHHDVADFERGVGAHEVVAVGMVHLAEEGQLVLHLLDEGGARLAEERLAGDGDAVVLAQRHLALA